MLREHVPSVVRLEAVDGGVDVANARLLLCTSKLLNSLPPAQKIPVPFSQNCIERWERFLVNSDRSFSNCVAALKVSRLLVIVVTMFSLLTSAGCGGTARASVDCIISLCCCSMCELL